MTLDISAIRQRIEKATPADWIFSIFTHHSGRAIESVEDVVETLAYSTRRSDRAELWGVAVEPFDEEGRIRAVCYTGNGPTSEANADLIAHAPADLRALCDEVERLRKYADHLPECARKRAWVEPGPAGGISFKSDPHWKCSCGLTDTKEPLPNNPLDPAIPSP